MINLKTFSIIIILFLITIVSVPHTAFAINSSVDSPSVADATNPLVGCETVDDCTWDAFLNTLSRVKDYGFQLVVVMSVIFIVYAGGLYLFAGDNSGTRSRANAILSNVVIGFFLAAAGWLIISTVLKTLGVDNQKLAPSELIR